MRAALLLLALVAFSLVVQGALARERQPFGSLRRLRQDDEGDTGEEGDNGEGDGEGEEGDDVEQDNGENGEPEVADPTLLLEGDQNEPPTVILWNYARNGDDWGAIGELCITGQEQSPINIVRESLAPVPQDALASRFTSPGVASGIKVTNTGHGIKIEWDNLEGSENWVEVSGDPTDENTPLNNFPYSADDELSPITMTPIQFHFHTPSEHTVDGMLYPFVNHIVHQISGEDLASCGEDGCLAVVGVPYFLSEECAPEFEEIFTDIPVTQGQVRQVSDTNPEYTLDLADLLPLQTEHVMYPGSLTTPTCLEGVRWHFLIEPRPICIDQIKAIQLAEATATQARLNDPESTVLAPEELEGELLIEVGARATNRWPQPLNNRTVYEVASSA